LGGQSDTHKAEPQIKDFRPSRLKRGPNLNLITTGSNLRFEFGAE